MESWSLDCLDGYGIWVIGGEGRGGDINVALFFILFFIMGGRGQEVGEREASLLFFFSQWVKRQFMVHGSRFHEIMDMDSLFFPPQHSIVQFFNSTAKFSLTDCLSQCAKPNP